MNRSHLGMAIAALGLAFSAPLAHGQNADTSEPARQVQADQQSAAASGDASTAPSQAGDDESTRRDAPKHPPTARMDRATPAEKAPAGNESSMHPPTGRMDSATPAERSPDLEGAAPQRSPDAGEAPAQQSPEPDTARPAGSTTT